MCAGTRPMDTLRCEKNIASTTTERGGEREGEMEG